MSMGPTHAISGLAAWSGVAVLGAAYDFGAFTAPAIVVGGALATGAALLPDLDHPSSTVARTFGPISKSMSAGINWLSHKIYRGTRTKKDSNRHGGHRGFTHTIVFAVLAGLATTALIQLSNTYALPFVMFFFCGLAVRGLLHEWHPKRDAMTIALTSAGLSLLCWQWVNGAPELAGACGLAVAIGCVAHFIGDAITEMGCPMLWPVPIAGKTWYPVAPPKILRMKTGGTVENMIVLPLFSLLALWLSVAALQSTGVMPWLGVDLLPWDTTPVEGIAKQ
ncbi:metal-dependent hydrolase [Allokutzneria sp. NRRL B-24872]|uniref:metal-dependent hydrolase n=1 Tax=Allokutzneria sp. NRRL B-24872 TaxID=1137961 RepID=UPI000A35F5C4|nr:metal-dependent hydrolase [Allokutzneria sp. NRRL B-24872]